MIPWIVAIFLTAALVVTFWLMYEMSEDYKERLDEKQRELADRMEEFRIRNSFWLCSLARLAKNCGLNSEVNDIFDEYKQRFMNGRSDDGD